MEGKSAAPVFANTGADADSFAIAATADVAQLGPFFLFDGLSGLSSDHLPDVVAHVMNQKVSTPISTEFMGNQIQLERMIDVDIWPFISLREHQR